jgi:hypothetical protein
MVAYPDTEEKNCIQMNILRRKICSINRDIRKYYAYSQAGKV